MKKTLTVSTALILIINLLLPITFVQAAGLKIGDYLQLGKYYGEPILWRCVDIDENGPLMLSDKIICVKAFDAATSVNNSTGSHGLDIDERKENGSNYWKDSNIRSWLNSEDSAGNVEWICGNPPEREYVDYNAYAQEAGFLSNFSQSEKSIIKTITQKTIVSDIEYSNGIYDSGSSHYSGESDISKAISRYDSAYSEQVTDRVFLLDTKQVNDILQNGDILGGRYLIAESTEAAKQNSEVGINSNSYWLRVPNDNAGGQVGFIGILGESIRILYTYARSGFEGIRPAFYLSDNAVFVSGSGIETDPFCVDSTGNINTSAEKDKGTELKPLSTITFNGNTYTIFDKAMPWNTAKEYCESLGGHLATITSAEEDSAIYNLMLNSGNRSALLGASDLSGEWRWVTDEEWNYINWCEGEPSGGGEHYLSYHENCGSQWNDWDEAPGLFICEWDGTNATTSQESTDTVTPSQGLPTTVTTSFGATVSSWAAPEIELAFENNLIPEIMLDYDFTKKVNRGEFAAIALQLYETLTNSETSLPPSCSFTDISGDIYEQAIKKAYGIQITAGTSATTFEPISFITREQLATMLCRVIKKYGFKDWTLETDGDYYMNTDGAKKFADDADISDWAKPSVYYMSLHGIIYGIDDTHFAPKNTTTQQEASGYATATREQAILLAQRIFTKSDMLGN